MNPEAHFRANSVCFLQAGSADDRTTRVFLPGLQQPGLVTWPPGGEGRGGGEEERESAHSGLAQLDAGLR